jgi:aspartyl-tRNA(Asn)/glutamyl-tRNA(Gln) amidotransferase subunit A
MQSNLERAGRSDDSLASLTAVALVQGFRALDFTPRDAAEAVLGRITALDPLVRAYAAIDPEVSLAAADASTRRYRDGQPLSELDGVPFGVKDMFATEDFPTAMGCRARFDLPWLEQDAPVVARLKEAGGILMGKTATPELSVGGTADNSFASPRNPWDTTRTCGGSSGGAAIAAALGMGPIQVGADTGGSIRIPAAFCGVVGLKPTHSRVPYWPWTPYAPFDHIGPVTRTAEDAALALSVMARADSRVPGQLPPLRLSGSGSLAGDIKGWRIGILHLAQDVSVDAEVKRLFDAAITALEARGAVCKPVTIDTSAALPILMTVAAVGLADVVDRVRPSDKNLIGPKILEAAAFREQLTVADYMACLEGRETLAATINAQFDRLDAIVSPTVPITAFAGGYPMPQDGPYAGASRAEWTPFTYPFSLSRHPSVSCPIGLSARDGLPIGMQIVAPLYREDMVLRIAQTLEKDLPALPDPRLLHELERNP